MSLSPRILHLLKLSAFVLILIFTFSYTFTPSQYTPSYTSWKNRKISGKKGAFIDKASTTEIDGHFDNSTLVDLCEKGKWIPGLIFKCESPSGGIANVRNIILNCLRFAIEAGGEWLFILCVQYNL